MTKSCERRRIENFGFWPHFHLQQKFAQTSLFNYDIIEMIDLNNIYVIITTIITLYT